jgi:hypothetical protein
MLMRLFDLRMIIGVLFSVYGVILTITGALDGSAEIAKGQGVRINLWTGLAMLVIGAIFIVWDVTRPEVPDAAATSDGELQAAPDGLGEGRLGTVACAGAGVADGVQVAETERGSVKSAR